MYIPSRGRRHRARKVSRQYAVAAVLAGIMLCGAAMVAMIVSVAGGRSDDARRSGELVTNAGLDLANLDIPVGSDRPNYRHSVVPGGVYTPDELRNVLVQDAIAANHYQGIDSSAVRVETVKQERFAYVSYRKDDQIYWTRNKVRLSEGETILTDGAQEIRARCGNCISETPQLPVAEVEPASVEFDQLADDSNGDSFLSAAIRSALESLSLSSGGGSRTPGAVGGGPAAGAPSAGAGSSALMASGSVGGGGNAGPTRLASRPTTLASGGPSFGGGAGGAALDAGGQPGDSPSSPGSPSTGDPGSPAANPPSVSGSSAGAPGPASGGTPGSPAVAIPSAPSVANAPANPSAPGAPRSDGPGSATPFPESAFVPSGTAASIPAGIDPLPGFDPETGVQPSESQLTPSAVGSQDASGDDPAVASLPEPGMLLLLGGGAAAAVLRRLRRRS
jgi:hypothetical protein